MYNKDKKRQSVRHGYSGSSNGYGGQNRGGGGFSARGRFGNSPRKKSFGAYIDPSRFVNKAKEVTAAEEYVPHNSFADFEISEMLKKNIASRHYTHPTPIQDQSIIHILNGKDVIGIANTGTGKTAAFLLPLIDKVSKNMDHETVLIVAPTRELALQIDDELRAFAKGMKIYSTLAIGGASMYRQKSELRRNPHFIIGTPGRLKDLAKQGAIPMSQCNNVVLDEVDRMVDIGFIKDIQHLISLLPKDRQSLFFSATVSGQVRDILDQFVTNPTTVSVKTNDTADSVEQDIVRVNGRNKIDLLHDILIKEGFDKVLIFGRTKWGVEKLTKDLLQRGFKAEAIHGNKTQGKRQRALDQFKRNEIQILLATDVASRGIDIENVSHVINYDVPSTFEDYVHRIGRTGRANKRGSALTFID